MKKHFLSFDFFLIVLMVILSGLLNLSCLGGNPPHAPFGSTVVFLLSPGDTTIPPDALEADEFEAQVTSPDGEPLNDVIVVFSLSFAGLNSIVADTNGDGLPDSKALQLVDPDACPGGCLNNFISTWFGFDAFIDSPFETLTNDFGVAKVIILFTNQNGTNIIDPASFSVSTQSGSVDEVEFTVNVP